MKVWEITVDGVTLGAVVDPNGIIGSGEALSKWNAQNPSYQGDTARQMRFLSV